LKVAPKSVSTEGFLYGSFGEACVWGGGRAQPALRLSRKALSPYSSFFGRSGEISGGMDAACYNKFWGTKIVLYPIILLIFFI
jgi:hypothetical protein